MNRSVLRQQISHIVRPPNVNHRHKHPASPKKNDVKQNPESRLTFKVPYSDIEIVMFATGGEKRSHGFIYNPLKAVPPIPWSRDCPHCQKGPKDWKPSVQQAVRTLGSTRFDPPCRYEFEVGRNYLMAGMFDRGDWTLRIFRRDRQLVMDVIQLAGKLPLYQGPTSDFRSRYIDRALKLILSARVPSDEEIQACLKGLLNVDVSTETDCLKKLPKNVHIQ